MAKRPITMHEADQVPGRLVEAFAKLATRIADTPDRWVADFQEWLTVKYSKEAEANALTDEQIRELAEFAHRAWEEEFGRARDDQHFVRPRSPAPTFRAQQARALRTIEELGSTESQNNKSLSNEVAHVTITHGNTTSEKYIRDDDTDDRKGTIEERLSTLDREYPASNAGKSVSERVRELFSEELGHAAEATRHGLAAADQSIPTQAPALWATDKLPNETPPEFIQRIYGQWLDRGLLAKPALRKLDNQAVRALDNWVRNPAHQLPEGFHLATLKEANDRWVERIEATGRPPTDQLTHRDALRLASVLNRRKPGERDKS